MDKKVSLSEVKRFWKSTCLCDELHVISRGLKSETNLTAPNTTTESLNYVSGILGEEIDVKEPPTRRQKIAAKKTEFVYVIAFDLIELKKRSVAQTV